MAGNNAKKRKREQPSPNDTVDTSKPTAVFSPTKPRAYTLSVALPGSIIANAQSHELKTTLAGQIARALAVFCVDEVIVYNDGHTTPATHQGNYHNSHSHHGGQAAAEDEYTGFADPDHFLFHLLSYLETPPHLRKFLFPLHPNLRSAGTLPSLDMPHHLRQDEWCQYREGVTIQDPDHAHQQGGGGGKWNKNRRQQQTRRAQNPLDAAVTGTVVHAGLPQKTTVPVSVPPNTRVTLKLPSSSPPASSTDPLEAKAVAPSAPRTEAGYYWGYTIRRASSLSAVFTEAPFDGGYDVTIGTSERGRPLTDALAPLVAAESGFHYNHLLLTFGGVAGLEVAVRADPELAGLGVTEPEKLFDHWLDLCPGQGSRTIRTEEAVWIGLMGVRGLVVANAR